MTVTINQEMFTRPIGGGTNFHPDTPIKFADTLDALKKHQMGKKSVITSDLPEKSNISGLSQHFESWYCAMIAYKRAEIGLDTTTLRRLDSHYSLSDFSKIIKQGEDVYPTFPPAATYMEHLLGGTNANQDHLNSGLNFIDELELEPLNYGVGYARLSRAFDLLVPHESGRLKVTDLLSRNFASTVMFQTLVSRLKLKPGRSLEERLEDISTGLMREIPYRHIGIRAKEINVGDEEAVSPDFLRGLLKLFEQELPSVQPDQLFAFILGNGFHFQFVNQGNKRTSITLAISLVAERNENRQSPIDKMTVPDLMHGSDPELSRIYQSIMKDGQKHKLISPKLVIRLAEHLNSLPQVPLDQYCDSIARDGLVKEK